MVRITFKGAQADLRALGVTLNRTAVEGEFRVALAGLPSRKAPSYYTDDLSDAVRTGKAMAREHEARLHAAAGGRQHYETAMRLADATNRL